MAKGLKEFVADALQTVPEATPEEVNRMIDEGGHVLLDVREPEEFAAGHLPGAFNVPRGFLEVKADLDHPKRDARLANRDQKIIAYCAGGLRSALAAKTLQEMGFTNVTSMSEGYAGWADRGLPSEK